MCSSHGGGVATRRAMTSGVLTRAMPWRPTSESEERVAGCSSRLGGTSGAPAERGHRRVLLFRHTDTQPRGPLLLQYRAALCGSAGACSCRGLLGGQAAARRHATAGAEDASRVANKACRCGGRGHGRGRAADRAARSPAVWGPRRGRRTACGCAPTGEGGEEGSGRNCWGVWGGSGQRFSMGNACTP